MFLRDKKPFTGESERYFLHKRHPILSGTFAACLTVDLNTFGCVVVNDWGTAIFPAHLYNGLRHLKGSISPWPLIEELIVTHKEDRVFIGRRPQNLEDCYIQILLVAGYSAHNFVPHRRRQTVKWSRNNVRRLENPSSIGQILHENFTPHRSMAFMIQDIEKVLIERARNIDRINSSTKTPQSRKWHATKRLTPLQLLQALRECMAAELPNLEYDYLNLHEQTFKLLQILASELHADFLKEFEDTYYNSERQWPAICKLALESGWMTENQDKQLVPRIKTSAWTKIGRIVGGFIKT